MSDTRDVRAFDRRAATYDSGWLGQWHRLLIRRVLDIVQTLELAPDAVLDVGCGTGQLLVLLSQALKPDTALVGIDPAAGMVGAARAAVRSAPRARVEQGAAESLPFPDGAFDLVLSSVSFDHWSDQQAGLRECARVLRPGGTLLLADLIAPWLALTTLRRRDRARTPRRVTGLIRASGMRPVAWRRVMSLGPLPLIQAVLAQPAEPE